MCGIAYVKRLDGKQASKMIEKRYQNQKSRGSDGFGYVAIDNGLVERYYKATTEKQTLADLEKVKASEILFHHRFPTSTPNFAQTAHPIKVSNKLLKYDYYVIHNGIISDDATLKEKHEEMGFSYTTEITQKWRHNENIISKSTMFNDSEALAIELALAIESEAKGIDLTGSIAFIALQVVKDTRKASKLYFGRNASNPLKLEMQKNIFFALTSEGQGESIDINVLYSFDYESCKIEEKLFNVGKPRVSYADTSYGYNAIDDDWYSKGSDYKDRYNQENYFSLLEQKQYLEEKLALEVLDDEDYIELEEELEDIKAELEAIEHQDLDYASKLPF